MSDGKYAFEKSKIIQGDCLEEMKLIPDGSIDMILADLPYGTTPNKWDAVIPFEPLWQQYWRVLKPSGIIALTASQPFSSALVMSQPKWYKHEWIWIKNRGSNFANTVREPMKEHEQVLIFSKGKWTYNKQMQERTGGGLNLIDKKVGTGQKQREGVGKFKEFNAIEKLPKLRVPSSWQKFNTQVGMHPTQKPQLLFEYLIKTYTNEGDMVLDNVAGSGTTGEACINLNRDFILIEKEPNYYEVIKERVGKIFKNYGLDLQPLLDERM